MDNVKEYIKRLQRLRWQHMVVRGEKVVELPGPPDGVSDIDSPGNESLVNDNSIDSIRQMPMVLEEVDNMSILAQKCMDCNVHDLYMTIMKVF
jgi:hypothetical protein